ncbi:MAG: hypothetical protein NVSMB32_12040 [Actinomycetota bacterium]
MGGFDIRWSVGLEATGDTIITMEQVVELADAVARMGGSAGGMGTTSYHATIQVYAEEYDQAVAKAREMFAMAAAKAGLPAWPVTRVEAENEAEIGAD